jgi:hypothetical protein
VVSAKHIWNIKENGMWLGNMGAYMKLCVILISITFIIKMLLIVLLCSEYNVDES